MALDAPQPHTRPSLGVAPAVSSRPQVRTLTRRCEAGQRQDRVLQHLTLRLLRPQQYLMKRPSLARRRVTRDVPGILVVSPARQAADSALALHP
eukprot:scaffold39147_cov58-Phaeocystis_antarctica.AAC.3